MFSYDELYILNEMMEKEIKKLDDFADHFGIDGMNEGIDEITRIKSKIEDQMRLIKWGLEK